MFSFEMQRLSQQGMWIVWLRVVLVEGTTKHSGDALVGNETTAVRDAFVAPLEDFFGPDSALDQRGMRTFVFFDRDYGAPCSMSGTMRGAR